MSERSFIFESKSIGQERRIGNKAGGFTYHISYNLRDGDTIAISHDYVVIKRYETGKIGLYNATTGSPILADVYDSIEVKRYSPAGSKYSQLCNKPITYYEVSVNGLYGAYSEFGHQKVPISYCKGITMEDGLFIVKNPKTGWYGVYNESGKEIIPEEFSYVYVRYGLIVTTIKSIIGTMMYVFNHDGKSIFKQQFKDAIKCFEKIKVSNSIIAIKENGLYTVCNREGKPIYNGVFKSINLYDNYFIAQAENGLWGLYANDGKELIPPKLKTMSKFDEKYIKGSTAISEYLFYYNGEAVLSGGMFKKITKTRYGATATDVATGKRVRIALDKTSYAVFI